MSIIGGLLQTFKGRMHGDAVRNFLLLTGERVTRSVLAVVVGAWVLRYLGPEASGSITFITANLTILAVVAKLGLDSIILRDINLKPEQRGVLLGTAVALQTAACVVMYGASLALGLVLGRSRLDLNLTLILSLVLIAQPLQMFELWFQGIGRVEKPVIARIVALLTVSALRVGAILSSLGILFFSALQSANEWITAALDYLFFKRQQTFKLQVSRSYGGVLLREAWPYLLSGLAVTAYTRIDQIMLGTILDKKAVGIFYAAYSLCEVLNFLPLAIHTSIFPIMARLKAEDEERYTHTVIRYCNWTLVYSLMITAVVWLLAPFVVSLLFGTRFAASTEVLRIYVLSFVSLSSGVAQTVWFINSRRGGVLLNKTVAGLITNVLLNLILIPRYGPSGAAWSTVASQFVAVFATNFVFDRRFAFMQLRSLVKWLPHVPRS